MLSSCLIEMVRKDSADHEDAMGDCSDSLQLLSSPLFHSYKPKCSRLTSLKCLENDSHLAFSSRVKSGGEMRQADTVTRTDELNR